MSTKSIRDIVLAELDKNGGKLPPKEEESEDEE